MNRKPATFRERWRVTALLVVVALATVLTATPIDQQRFLDHIKVLSSDELQGRGNGTPGLDKAADYIGSTFRAIGLQPGGEAGSYFQTFEIVTGLQVGSPNSLVLTGPGGSRALELGRDYFPLSVNSSLPQGAAAGKSAEPQPGQAGALPIVFAGYGISAPGLDYDDYSGVDVGGKAVLIFTHEPQENDANSRFDGRANTTHAAVLTKAMVARAHNARLVLIVEDQAHETDGANYKGFLQDPQADEYGVPVVRVARDQVNAVLSGVLDLKKVASEIDADMKPRSRVFEGVSVSLVEHFARNRRPVRNVVGILQGHDPARAAEAVVVGGHYDHLGLGGRHSLAPNSSGQIHHGADDNASGVAAMMEIARVAASDRGSLGRTLVFVAFAGEELGLLGSTYYVNHPAVPLERTLAMINLDMVGRPNGRILVSGLDTAPALDEDLEAAGAGSTLQVRTFKEGASVGSSDDTSFILRKVPAIGFFSGFHEDYHRPGDTWEKIDAAGGAEVARIALVLAERLASRSDRVAFVEPKRPVQATGAQASGGEGGYGAYFGSVPDFGESDSGFKFADIRAGSPADKAGLRKGDVLTRFDGKPIKTIYDFTFALRSKRPGDKVEVVVMRDGQEIKATVELGSRQ